MDQQPAIVSIEGDDKMKRTTDSSEEQSGGSDTRVTGIGQTSGQTSSSTASGHSTGLCDKASYRKFITMNKYKLLEKIEPDTELYAALIAGNSKTLPVIKRVWSIKCPVDRVNKLLDYIVKYEKFDSFCEALCICGQANIIPLLTSEYIQEERVTESLSPDFETQLPKEIIDILGTNWNDIIKTIECDDAFLKKACDEGIILELQSKSWRGEDNMLKRNGKLLNVIENSSLGKYKRFVTLLKNTGYNELSTRLSEAF